jgi:hypothetical protein
MSEQLKIVIDADVNRAVNGLSKLGKEFSETSKDAASFGSSINKSVTLATQSLGKFHQTSGQSIQVLGNLSRVAQDAPFGFIAIANNLNPLIESFQRLQVQAKATGQSLIGSLGAALSGPAGIGLALGVGSSLLIAFGDDLKKLINPASEFSDAIDKAADGLDKNAAKVIVYANALKSGTLSASDAKKVQKELIDQAPEFQSAFDGNKLNVEALDKVLSSKYIPSLIKSIKVSAAFGIVNEKLADSIKQIAKGGTDFSFGQTIENFFASLGGFTNQTQTFAKNVVGNITEAENALKSENISKLIEDTFKSLGITFQDAVDITEDGKKKIGKSIEQLQNELIGKARLFAKEFGNAFVVPNLEETFFNTREKVLASSKNILSSVDSFLKGNIGALKVKIPIQTDFELLPEPKETITKEIEDNFFKSLGFELNIPVEPKIKLTDLDRNMENIKSDLRKTFADFGNVGKAMFAGIDFSKFNAGVEIAKERLAGLKIVVADIGSIFQSAFSGFFDAIEKNKSVVKGFFDGFVNGLKRVVEQLIATAALSGILSLFGFGSFTTLFKGFIGISKGGAANFGLGNQIGSRAFSNTLQVVVSGQISGQNILLSGQRAANSGSR